MKPLACSLLFICIQLYATNAEGCDCNINQTPIDAYREAAAVFTGKVVEVNRYRDYNEVVFDIYEIWRGIIDYQIIIQTKSTSCDWAFVPNSEYLVYAFQYDDGTYGTDKCTRTNLLRHAKEDRQTLGQGININNAHSCTIGNYVDTKPNSFCGKILAWVCRCDGISYPNSCYAEKNGIVEWTSGRCKE